VTIGETKALPRTIRFVQVRGKENDFRKKQKGGGC